MPNNFKDYKLESRKDWGAFQDGAVNISQMQAGAVLRIADSLEKMEKPFDSLLRQVQSLRLDAERSQKRDKMNYRRIAALRGVITRLKRAK